MRTLILIFAITLVSFGQAQKGLSGRRCTIGESGQEKCVDHKWLVCKCRGSRCYWMCPSPFECLPCSDSDLAKADEGDSGGCSDPSDLGEELRTELDSAPPSCIFPCNCIASGNQIAHKLNVKTPEDCDYFCKSFPKFCKFWTLVKSRGLNICFALTNCNFPKCGAPFHDKYISGPRGCPPAPRTSLASSGCGFGCVLSLTPAALKCALKYNPRTKTAEFVKCMVAAAKSSGCLSCLCGFLCDKYPSTCSICSAVSTLSTKFDFTITNRVPNREASGLITFQGVDCPYPNQKYKDLNFGQIQTITTLTKCLPVILISATLNGGTICEPFSGLENDPRNVFICPVPMEGGILGCEVKMNSGCI